MCKCIWTQTQRVKCTAVQDKTLGVTSSNSVLLLHCGCLPWNSSKQRPFLLFHFHLSHFVNSLLRRCVNISSTICITNWQKYRNLVNAKMYFSRQPFFSDCKKFDIYQGPSMYCGPKFLNKRLKLCPQVIHHMSWRKKIQIFEICIGYKFCWTVTLLRN